MPNNLKNLSRVNTPVRPGHYRVNAAGLSLIVEENRVYLTGQTTNRIVFTIPLDHHVEADPEDTSAREKVLRYLSAAWAYHQWPLLNAWMEAQEDAEGMSVWRLKYCYNDTDGFNEVRRPLVEQEVTAWLNDQPQEQ